jgi:hypothetical protein
MRGDVIKFNIKAINKQFSGLTVKCLEIPHYAYSSRCAPFEKTAYPQGNMNEND